MSSRITTSFLLDAGPVDALAPARSDVRLDGDVTVAPILETVASLRLAARASALTGTASDEEMSKFAAAPEAISTLEATETKATRAHCKHANEGPCAGACGNCRRRSGKN